jgi:hypothetical protein
MEPNRNRGLSAVSRRELVRLCNDKMVCAARDLAEFTKKGVYASFLVALAHKCEALEQSLDQPQRQEENPEIEQDVCSGLMTICDTGRQIWHGNPNRYNDYVLP